MADFFLQLSHVSVTLGGQPVLKDINLTIQSGEQWAITGPSGSGKTVLAHTLAGRHFYSGHIITAFGTPETFHRYILVVEQQHRFADRSNRHDFYYQQRFNSFDADKTITVGEELERFIADEAPQKGQVRLQQLMADLHISHLHHSSLLQLSNGENKRLQLAKALLLHPQLLVLDYPFLGLDADGRLLLQNILTRLTEQRLSVVVITDPHEIPGCVTHVATLQNGSLSSTQPRGQYKAAEATATLPFTMADLQQLPPGEHPAFETAVKMVDVNIRYNNKAVLQHINWEVKRGAQWSVSGPNGAGKSTLLSLITADNPQAYANAIYLFDRKRGSGESIWDIKKNIGYVSPELHLYFDYTVNSFQAIASGLFDTIGLFRQLTEDQEQRVWQWMKLLQLTKKRNTILSNLSAGEQRLVLLARALVKNPPLLILDEPTQGLDEEQRRSFKKTIEVLVAHFNTTLIYVSHYTADIPAGVTNFLRLDNGRIIA